MRTGRHSPLFWMMLSIMLPLSGCGTNVMYLLKEESRIMAEADPLLLTAEEAGNGLEHPVYEAESAKDKACEFLHQAVFDRFNRDPGFFEQFVSDLSASVVLIFPIARMEDCAEAFYAYSDAVDNLASAMNDAAELPRSDASIDAGNSVN